MKLKKEYLHPKMEVVALKHGARLLSDSNGNPDSFDVIVVPRP